MPQTLIRLTNIIDKNRSTEVRYRIYYTLKMGFNLEKYINIYLQRSSMNTLRVVLVLTLLTIIAVPSVMAYEAPTTIECHNKSNHFVIPSTDSTKDDVHFNWCSRHTFEDESIAGVAAINGNWSYLNKNATITNRIIFHELSHSLGYRHYDDGIARAPVDNDVDDGTNDRLEASTLETARTFKGFKIIEWDTEGIQYMIREYTNGDIASDKQMNYSIQKFLMEDPTRDVYYASNWNNFGEHYTQQRTFMGLPMNIRKGYFYGLPAEKDRLRDEFNVSPNSTSQKPFLVKD